MARTITPVIETPKCDTHKVELIEGVCPRCEYIRRKNTNLVIQSNAAHEELKALAKLREEEEEKNDTTPNHLGVGDNDDSRPIPEARRRTKMPEDKEYLLATRCYWPCPCGGTVPDVPESCKHRKFAAKAKTFCTDSQLCISCTQRITCPAFEKWNNLIKKRRKEDVARFESKPKKED